MDNQVLHYGILSLLPAVLALGLAVKSKRVIESLLLGIASGAFIIDAHVSGVGHALLFSITNTFSAVAGHPSNSELGLRGVGLVRNSGRAEVIIFILLLGAFITILEKSGGAYAFGNWLSDKVKTNKGAKNATAIMGCSLFTSAYFSSLATGTVFKPIYDKQGISREKLAFIIDSTSAPINALIPISGWVAYMGALMVDNIPDITDPIVGLVRTMPFNFYCISIIAVVFLVANEKIKDFGPMKKKEEEALTTQRKVKESTIEGVDLQAFAAVYEGSAKQGQVSDMLVPLAVSVSLLVVLGLWNYTIVNFFNVKELPIGGNGMLIISFSMGLIVAYIKYVSSKLMTSKEFLDDAIEGSKSAIIGGMIITLAVTLGDLLRASAPEGLGASMYLQEVIGGLIPAAIVPLAVFLLAAFTSFSMGTSWGTWGIMMPIAIPLTLAAGGNPFLAAAAVLSGGAFGDHCSPISDTTVMSSIGAGCEHMDHVNTQLPYALLAASVAAGLFLIAGFIV